MLLGLIEETKWEREDWRNAGAAYRWYCVPCSRFGPYDVTEAAVRKAASEHVCVEGS